MIKDGVRLVGLQPQMVLAFVICEPILKEYGQSIVITSGSDGRHSNGSRHYCGYGMDLRTRDMADDSKQKATDTIKLALGGEYYVQLESNHLHISWKGSAC